MNSLKKIERNYIPYWGTWRKWNNIISDFLKPGESSARSELGSGYPILEFSILLIPIVGIIALFAIFRKYKKK